jgi:hypothetical protein
MADDYTLDHALDDVRQSSQIRLFGRVIAGVPSIKLARVKAFSVAGICTRLPENQWPLAIVPDDGQDPGGKCGFKLPDKMWMLDPRAQLTLLRPESGPAEKVLGLAMPACGCSSRQTDSRPSILDDCVAVTIEDGEACLEIDYAGEVCVSVPEWVPNGTVAEACVKVCKKWGVPVGARLKIIVAGVSVACDSWGDCSC